MKNLTSRLAAILPWNKGFHVRLGAKLTLNSCGYGTLPTGYLDAWQVECDQGRSGYAAVSIIYDSEHPNSRLRFSFDPDGALTKCSVQHWYEQSLDFGAGPTWHDEDLDMTCKDLAPQVVRQSREVLNTLLHTAPQAAKLYLEKVLRVLDDMNSAY